MARKSTIRKFKRLQRTETRVPDQFLLDHLTIKKYKNPSNVKLYRRTENIQGKPRFEIKWCLPNAHYIWKVPRIRKKYRIDYPDSLLLKLHYMELAGSGSSSGSTSASVESSSGTTKCDVPPPPSAARPNPSVVVVGPSEVSSSTTPPLAESTSTSKQPTAAGSSSTDDKKPQAAEVPYDPSKTAYLVPYLMTEYPDLDYPSATLAYIAKSYNRHLSTQTLLTQQEALEMMLSCHDKFQMAHLIVDMQYRAEEFCQREKCEWRHPANYPQKYEMHADDVWTLARDLLGRTFHPSLHGKGVGDDFLLHEIGITVNESMQPVKRLGNDKYNCHKDDWIIF